MKTIEEYKKELEVLQTNIATQRDSLTDLRLEITQQEDDCDEAEQYIRDAIDSLSRLV